MTAVLSTRGLTARYGDRILFRDLTLTLEAERVALVGRNGVGKSTLLSLLAGRRAADDGQVDRFRQIQYLPQFLASGVGSPGERRRRALAELRQAGQGLLLLDEPTHDLDQESVEWLRWWLSEWRGGALVASHDRRLLQDFQHFFVMEESGCRYLQGSLEAVEEELERSHKAEEIRYLRCLNLLEREEERTLHLARRRRRKKQYGRCSELDRATPKAALNQKRSDAQVSHGKINRKREKRLREFRQWARSARRALKVELPMELTVPELGPVPEKPLLSLSKVSVLREERTLFHEVSLDLRRDKLGLEGPNGSGKTTLIQTMLGEQTPDCGAVSVQRESIGLIAQGATNWDREESLLDLVSDVELIVAHRFPMALAQRPLRSLSAGERVRAALVCLWGQVEMLVLDEPTCSLDLVGQRALTRALKAWPGGLVVASHDRDFLQSVTSRRIRLGQ